MACGCRGAIELRLPAGAAVLWRTCKCTGNPHLPFACDSLRGKGSELRLLVFVACWHCVGPQLGLETRKIVHIGYHHRWLRPTDYNEQVRYQGHHFRAHLWLIFMAHLWLSSSHLSAPFWSYSVPVWLISVDFGLILGRLQRTGPRIAGALLSNSAAAARRGGAYKNNSTTIVIVRASLIYGSIVGSDCL